MSASSDPPISPSAGVPPSAGGWEPLAIVLDIVVSCVAAARFMRHASAVAAATSCNSGACGEGRGMVLVLPVGIVFTGCVAISIVVTLRCLVRVGRRHRWAVALLGPLVCGVVGYLVATGLAEGIGRVI